MKGGKDEEKAMGPLFPRLHINDAEKGGPKAPPRNKMALYEQLSIPTQRFTSGSSNMLPLPHKNSGNLVPSASSTHHKKSSYSLLAERLHAHTSVGAILNTSSNNRTEQLKVNSVRDSVNLSIATPCSKFQPQNFSNFKSSSTKRPREEDDCRVPGFLRLESTLNSVDDPLKKDDRVRTSRHLKSTSDLFLKHQISTKGNLTMPWSCEGNTQKPTSISGNRDEVLETRNCFQKYQVIQKTKVPDSENVLEKSSACLKPSLRTNDQSHSNDYEAEKDVEATETCNLDSVSGVTISPDAVVEAIGQKQFWKARKAIVQQQKVFAMQVFELHRLIKVQKLFAENPDILMEDKLFMGKPPIDSNKKLYLENVPEPPPISPHAKDYPQIPIPMSDSNKGLNNPFPNYKAFSGTDPIPSPWCFQPPPLGNQWLVPVMSPSEGLIYKPYTGPCPPATRPMGLGPSTPTVQDYLRFGFFPPYCVPSLNPSSSVVGPVGPSGKARPKPDQIPYSTSFSSYCMRNLIDSKESEMHGSTASSPDTEPHENVLPLFPTAPTAEKKSEKTQTSMNSARVIKVVPHNARSASESAARIFRSIQEERRQLE